MAPTATVLSKVRPVFCGRSPALSGDAAESCIYAQGESVFLQHLKDCNEDRGKRWMLDESNFEYNVLPLLPAGNVVPYGTTLEVRAFLSPLPQSRLVLASSGPGFGSSSGLA